MSDGKESDKNHTIEDVATILAVSTMMFFLIVLPAYGHSGRLDANGGHTDSKTGKYHKHRTPKEMLELIDKKRQKQDELLQKLEETETKLKLLNKDAVKEKESLEEKKKGLIEELGELNKDPSGDKFEVKPSKELESGKGLRNVEQKNKFLGTGFGVGVGLLHGLGTKNASATLDENGIVNVDKDETRAIDLLLEAHYYPEEWRYLKGNFAHGPFVFLNRGAIDTDTETLSTFGVGWMMGVRVAGGNSINIGLAYALRKGVQSLRSDFVAGQKGPIDDMGNFIEPQYTKSTEGAWVVLVSFAPL